MFAGYPGGWCGMVQGVLLMRWWMNDQEFVQQKKKKKKKKKELDTIFYSFQKNYALIATVPHTRGDGEDQLRYFRPSWW
jgi:hypothetical protein